MRRDQAAYKLRCYIDGLKQAESTTDEEWLAAWVGTGLPWMSRQVWIEKLKEMIAAEAIKVYERKVA